MQTMTSNAIEMQRTIERMAELKGRIERTPKTERRYQDYVTAFDQLSEQLHKLACQD